MEINWDEIDDSIEELTFKNDIKYGKVVSVYDGDTIKVVFLLGDKLYKWNCRLDRVDTPELRTRNDLEKELGYSVRDKLREKILNKIVKIKCGDFDKYGRLLTEIYINDNESVNQWLIDNKMAFEYHGGTKQDWGEYLENQNKNQQNNNEEKKNNQENNEEKKNNQENNEENNEEK